MKKRSTQLLSLFLAFALVIGLCPISARAADVVAEVTDANGNVTSYTNISEAWQAAKGGQDRTFKMYTDWRDIPDSLTLWDGLRLTIDLNGHTIARSTHDMDSGGDGSVIFLHENAQLTINDTSKDKSGSIENGNDKEGGGIHTEGDNIVTMNAGTIQYCKAKYGGGVYLEDDSKLILNGGSISSNRATSQGGGVYAEYDSTVETHGGEIISNTSDDEGGGIYLWSSAANLNNCQINFNQADEGGAIYVDYSSLHSYSSLNLNNTWVTHNTAKSYGGIYFGSYGIGLRGNTRIAQNSCYDGDAAGIYSKSSIWLHGGDIQVFGNKVNYSVRDIAFKSSSNAGFRADGVLGSKSMIGVYTGNGNAPTHMFFGTHWMGSDCTYNEPGKDPTSDSVCRALFSNNQNTFSQDGEFYYDGDFGLTFHEFWINEKDGGDNGRKVSVESVTYKNEEIPASDYSFGYAHGSRTLTLNVPDYVLDTTKLWVGVWVDGQWTALDGKKDVDEKTYLEISRWKRTPDYKIKVEGGYIDGDSKKTETTKKYKEDFTIQPTIPAGEQFAYWEVTGGDGSSYQSRESRPSLEMPKHDLTFKAVFRQKISRIDFTITDLPIPGKPVTGSKSPISVSINGGSKVVELKPRDWSHWASPFKYNATYDVFLRLNENEIEDGTYCLADQDELKIYVNGQLIPRQDYEYHEKTYSGGREIKFNYFYTTPKPKVTTVEAPTIHIVPNITVDELAGLLPSAVKITYQGNYKDNGETIESLDRDVPVSWSGLNGLPDTITGDCTLTGTVTIPDDLEAAQAQKTTTLTVHLDSNMQRLAAPTASVEDGAHVAWGEHFFLRSTDPDVTFWYREGDSSGAFTKYTESGLFSIWLGEHTFYAYSTKAGYPRSDLLKLTVTVDPTFDMTVRVVDKNGNLLDYDSGAGKYQPDAIVTINGVMDDNGKTVTHWSADGITLEPSQTIASSFSFKMPDHRVTITADEYSYPVTIADAEGNTWKYADGAGMHVPGEQVTINGIDGDSEKTVARWSATGINLTEEQKTSPSFTFTMPENSVTIQVEDYRYYVSKLYLSSLTPIAGTHLPTAPEIVGAVDSQGMSIEDPPLKIKVWQWYIGDNPLKGSGTLISDTENYIVQDGQKYTAILSIEPTSGGKRETTNDLTVYIDGQDQEPDTFLGSTSYLVDWDFTAAKDTLQSVDLGDTITAYTGNTLTLPSEVNVKTQHDSITKAEVTWNGTVDTSKIGSQTVTGTLQLPDYVAATDAQKNLSVTVQVRSLVDNVVLETKGGDVPTKLGESLPTDLTAKSKGVKLTDFSISPKGGTAAKGTEYKLTAKIVPETNYELAPNTTVTIDGIAAQLSRDETGSYILTYTFATDESRTCTVTFDANGGTGKLPAPASVSVLGDGDTTRYVLPAADDVTGMKKENCVFLGWTTAKHDDLAADGTKPEDLVAELDVGDNISVYALWGVDENGNGKWDGDENTLTLDKGDYKNASIPNPVRDLDPGAALPTDITTLEGNAVYKFVGWKCSADDLVYPRISSYNNGKMPKQSITMTAQWTKKVQVAYVDSEGKTLAETETFTVPEGSMSYTAQLKAIADYNFVGAVAEKIYEFQGTETTIPIITLRYQLTSETHTVTFDANGGKNPPSAVNVTVPSGGSTNYTLPDAGGMTREGYVFLGWAATKDGSAVDSIEVSKDTTVYALWGVDSNGNGEWDGEETAQKLTFAQGDYANAAVPAAQDILPGGSLPTITNPTGNDVYQFAGWQCSVDGKTYENILAYNGGKMPKDKDVTMTALWTKKIQVAYVEEGTNKVLKPAQSITVPADRSSYTATPETIEGYAFIGADADKTYEFKGTEDAIPTITLKYQLPAKTCWVTFDANGGSGAPEKASVEVAAGSSSASYTLPTDGNPTRTGCVFLGWTTTQHETPLAADGTKPDDIVTSIDVSENTTVYALWGVDSTNEGKWDGEKTQRKLTFVAGDYKSATVPEEQSIPPGGNPSAVTDPTGNDVYHFAGWKCSVDGKTYTSLSNYTMPDRAVTMTAQWEKKINVAYANNLQPTETVTLPADQDTYTAKPKEITGYTFVSANPTQYEFQGNESEIPTITLTYNKTYTVTFDANGGSGAPAPQTVTVAGGSSSASYELPGAGGMTWEGHVFRGWMTAADATQTVTEIGVSANTTVYALWGEDTNGNGVWDGSEKKYTLTIANGEYSDAGVASTSQRLSGISLADIKNPESNDVYTFKGWKYSAGSTTYASVSDFNNGKMPDANVTLTAQWEKKLEVSYVKNDTSTELDHQTVTLPAGQKSYTAEAKNIAGYTFVSAAPARSYTFTGSEETVPTIKLTYREADRTYKVTFDANGGVDAPAAVSVTVTGGSNLNTYKLPTAEQVTGMTKRDRSIHYVFLGWTTTKHADLTAADTKPTTVDSINVTAYATVYALWGIDENNDGKWDGAQGTYTLSTVKGDYPSATLTESSTDYLPGTVLPTLANPTGNAVYTFKGWKCSADDKTYDSLSGYTMPNENVTMTAQWEKKLQIAYVDGSGQAVQAAETVTVAVDQTSCTAAAKQIAGYRLVSDSASETYTFTGTENAVPTITFTYRKVSSSSGGSSGGTAAKTEITTNPDGTITITPPKNAGKTTVELPVQDVTPGTVAILVKPDGTEEIMKDALPTANGIELTVEGTVTVKIVDNAKRFTDIQGHWAKDAIDFVSARGLVNGMTETTFAPNAPTTRAQLWTILARQAGVDLTGGSTWYEKAQAWAMSSGISDGSDPNGNITRAQMVTMLWRAAGSPAVSGGSTAFTDVPEDSYYTQAVAWAAENGITTGVGDGKFDPNGTCTRAQIATFLYRTYVNRT